MSLVKRSDNEVKEALFNLRSATKGLALLSKRDVDIYAENELMSLGVRLNFNTEQLSISLKTNKGEFDLNKTAERDECNIPNAVTIQLINDCIYRISMQMNTYNS